MNKTKAALLAVIALVVAVGAGYLWGAWGRWDLDGRLRATELKAGLAESKSALYAARVDLAELNYGQAGGNLERARRAMQTLAEGLERAGRSEATAAVREAMAKAGAAQQSAASIDQGAAGRISEAIKALARADAPAQTK